MKTWPRSGLVAGGEGVGHPLSRLLRNHPLPLGEREKSVPEMSHAGEDHGKASFIGGGNYFVIAH
jgi:hypothetical protein